MGIVKGDLLIDYNAAIHCPTKKLSDEVCTILDSLGYTYCTGHSFAKYYKWDHYERETCYSPSRGSYGTKDCYANTCGDPIVEAEEFIKLHNKAKLDCIEDETVCTEAFVVGFEWLF